MPRLSIPIANDRVVCKNQEFRVGDRVVLSGDRSGIIRWIGKLDSDYVTSEVFVGVQLDEPIGAHNGVFRGKRYFLCPDQHGVFVSKKVLLYVKSRCELNYRPLIPISPRKASEPRPPPSSSRHSAQVEPEPEPEPVEPSPSHLDAHQQYMVERLREAQRLGQEWLKDQHKMEQELSEARASREQLAASDPVPAALDPAPPQDPASRADSEALSRAEASVRAELEIAREKLLSGGDTV